MLKLYEFKIFFFFTNNSFVWLGIKTVAMLAANGWLKVNGLEPAGIIKKNN